MPFDLPFSTIVDRSSNSGVEPFPSGADLDQGFTWGAVWGMDDEKKDCKLDAFVNSLYIGEDGKRVVEWELVNAVESERRTNSTTMKLKIKGILRPLNWMPCFRCSQAA
jgi:hypothetical protein